MLVAVAVGVAPHVDAVAILTDPGGTVLAARSRDTFRSRRGCDPHRPRRDGAGFGLLAGQLARVWLRSSPTPEGRCWSGVRKGAKHYAPVAILTDPGGTVLAGGAFHAFGGDGAVAILTDPGGTVLDQRQDRPGHGARVAILTDPGGTVPGGRCRRPRRRPHRCDPHRPRRDGAGHNPPDRRIAVLPSCDPHRPRRDGAGRGGAIMRIGRRLLRSSPTPEGRCWTPCASRRHPARSCCDPHRPRRDGAGTDRATQSRRYSTWVAILTDPGGTVLGLNASSMMFTEPELRSSPTPEGRCWSS